MDMNYYIPIPPVHEIDLRGIDLTHPNDDGLVPVDCSAKDAQITALEHSLSDIFTNSAQRHARNCYVESIGIHIQRSSCDQEPFCTQVMVVKPIGPPCFLGSCVPGYFISGSGDLCLKTEYRTFDGMSEAFCSSGECFWGGTTNKADRDMLLVQPVKLERIVGVRTHDNPQ
jgi:hypothetical protein